MLSRSLAVEAAVGVVCLSPVTLFKTNFENQNSLLAPLRAVHWLIISRRSCLISGTSR